MNAKDSPTVKLARAAAKEQLRFYNEMMEKKMKDLPRQQRFTDACKSTGSDTTL